MATSLTAPQVLTQPFANGATPSAIPSAPTGTNAASLTEGIPAVCSTPLGTGGLPVRRADFNNLGYLATSNQFFQQNGGVYSYSSDVATAIGGYPSGARLWATIGGQTVICRSLVNNNSLNPATNIDGVNWTIDIPVRPKFIKIASHSSQSLTQTTTTTAATTFTLSGFAGTGLDTKRITSLKVLCSMMGDSGGDGVCTITATAGSDTITIFGSVIAAPNNDSFGASALIDVPINDGQTSTTISIVFSGYWQGATASTEIVGAIQQ